MENKRNIFIILLRFFIKSMFIAVFFILGMTFEQWGGVNRAAPSAINFLRNNIFGDEFVLRAEKKAFSVNDYMKQKKHEREDKLIIAKNEITKKPLVNEQVIKLANSYVLDYDSFNSEDIGKLKILSNNYFDNLEPLFDPVVKDEGIWEKHIISEKNFKPLYSKTFLRTDEKRKFVKVFIYRFDMDRLKLEFIPGKEDIEDEIISGKMSPDQINKVLWAFSGGYQYRHGNFGMKYNNEILLAPRNDASTIVFYNNGDIKITPWSDDYLDDSSIYAFRQNELPLIVDGKITEQINRMWGLTPDDVHPIYTVRTGMGLTADGDLIFAFGEHLSAETLALGMVRAGVIDGMHLDMNYYNSHLVSFDRNEQGSLMSRNENDVLSFYNKMYCHWHYRDYFILLDRSNSGI